MKKPVASSAKNSGASGLSIKGGRLGGSFAMMLSFFWFTSAQRTYLFLVPLTTMLMLRISYGGGHMLRRTWGLARADEVIE